MGSVLRSKEDKIPSPSVKWTTKNSCRPISKAEYLVLDTVPVCFIRFQSFTLVLPMPINDMLLEILETDQMETY